MDHAQKSWEFLAFGLEVTHFLWLCGYSSHCVKQSRKAWPRRPKKKPGAGKRKTCVWKRDLRGQIKRPLPSKNCPGGPCDPLPDTNKQKIPRNVKPVAKRARSTAPPGPHSGAGRVRRPGGMPRTTTGPPLLVGVKKAAKHNRKGKQKQQKETTKTPLPPCVQKKGLRRGERAQAP